MKIYDSLSQSKRDFVPIIPGQVKLYVCGNTVYDDCHIGHARAAVVFDMAAHAFRALGYQVTLVRNITDIDDKIIQRALENGEETSALTARVIATMHHDEQTIAVQPPDHEPRATEYLDEMVAFIQRLIGKGFAYPADNGDVYYEVKSFQEYGKLSRRDVEHLVAGSRVEVNPHKKDPLDFALWKNAKPGEPAWPSPWGDGRPGWHIECSAMAHELLGSTFDIHGGGMDLKFPHHENEIAQSEAANGCAFANYWMHVGLLTINEEKMSKSLGNSVTISDFLQQHHYEVLRHFMLASHYRSPVNYTEDAIHNSQLALERLYTAMRGLPTVERPQDHPLEQAFHQAMADDFNTSQAFSILFEIAREINRLRQTGEVAVAAGLSAILRHCGAIMGVLQQDPEVFLQGDRSKVDALEVERLIAARNEARDNKDWEKADQLRQQLDDMGVVLEDSSTGTQWRLQ